RTARWCARLPPGYGRLPGLVAVRRAETMGADPAHAFAAGVGHNARHGKNLTAPDRGARNRALTAMVGDLAAWARRGRERLHADRPRAAAAGVAGAAFRVPACAGAPGHDQQWRPDAGRGPHPRT